METFSVMKWRLFLVLFKRWEVEKNTIKSVKPVENFANLNLSKKLKILYCMMLKLNHGKVSTHKY